MCNIYANQIYGFSVGARPELGTIFKTYLPTYLPMQVQSNQQYFVPEPTGKYVTSVTRFGEILPFWLLLWLVVNFLGP